MTVRSIGFKTVVLACASALLLPAPAMGQTPPNTWASATGGFGDERNDWAWSMQWFAGKLYVGTSRSGVCVQRATIDFYFPNVRSYQPDAALGCPADKYDMDLRGEIWELTPATSTWRRVYQSPEIPNPRAPGKMIARYMGLRGMAVHTDASGEQALYVATVTPNEYIPEFADDNPPRLLRTTDGETFTAVAGAPGTIDSAFGVVKPMGLRSITSVGGRLFVTATNGANGDGVIMEVKDPGSPEASWAQVSPNTMVVFELEAFDGALYVGTGDLRAGYGVYRGALRDGGIAFTPVVTGGAGRPWITSVVSMHPYQGRLYVGANAWNAWPTAPEPELIRVDPTGHWDIVAGDWRFLPDGTLKAPISGLPDGFGNSFNGHFWRMQAHEGALYVGTLDWSWLLRDVPFLADWLRPEFGFDIYGTCDGAFWWRVTRDAFGDGLYNFGARTMASTPAGGFVGTTNDYQGAVIFQSTAQSWCARPQAPQRVDGAEGVPDANAAAPRRVVADVQRGGVVLSWERARGAVRYRVLRARYRLMRNVPMPTARALPDGFLPGLARPRGRWRPKADMRVLRGYKRIGTTRRTWFIDRTARPRVRYDYLVVAIGRRGARRPSNIVMVPSARPAVTFAEADAALRRLAGSHRAGLRERLARVRDRWAGGDRSGALARLNALAGTGVARAATARAAQPAAEDARDVLMRLERRLRYAGIAERGG